MYGQVRYICMILDSSLDRPLTFHLRLRTEPWTFCPEAIDTIFPVRTSVHYHHLIDRSHTVPGTLQSKWLRHQCYQSVDAKEIGWKTIIWRARVLIDLQGERGYGICRRFPSCGDRRMNVMWLRPPGDRSIYRLAIADLQALSIYRCLHLCHQEPLQFSAIHFLQFVGLWRANLYGAWKCAPCQCQCGHLMYPDCELGTPLAYSLC
jgi:hypothetical protein